MILPQLCGIYILLSYTTAFFDEAGSTLKPVESAILISLVQLVANSITVFLIDRLGRKIIFTTSSIGTGIGLFVLAMHRAYRDVLPESDWVPMYGLSITIFIASIGLLPVPFVMTIDVLPPKVCFHFKILIWQIKKKENSFKNMHNNDVLNKISDTKYNNDINLDDSVDFGIFYEYSISLFITCFKITWLSNDFWWCLLRLFTVCACFDTRNERKII